jgi:hypothetical protein
MNRTNKAPTIFTPENLNIEDVLLLPPKMNSKTKILMLGLKNSRTRSPWYIETPYLINAFGLSYYDPQGTMTDEQKNYVITLKEATRDQEEIPKVNSLFTFLRDLDNMVLDYGIQHSKTIFKKEYKMDNKETLKDLIFNKGVKVPTKKAPDGNPDYPDSITLKVMKNQDTKLPELLLFKDSLEPLHYTGWDELVELIPKGTPVKAIFQPKLYYVNGKLGITYKVLQVKLPIYERIGKPLGYAFAEKPENSVITNENTEQNVKEITKENSEKEDSEKQDSEKQDSDIEEENSDTYEVHV